MEKEKKGVAAKGSDAFGEVSGDGRRGIRGGCHELEIAQMGKKSKWDYPVSGGRIPLEAGVSGTAEELIHPGPGDALIPAEAGY